MPVHTCHNKMSFQKGAKVVAMVDVVYSIIMLGLVAIRALSLLSKMMILDEDDDNRLSLEAGALPIFCMVILGLIFGIQLYAAVPLYNGAKRNDGNCAWKFFIAAAAYTIIFFLGIIESIRQKRLGLTLFSLVAMAYKTCGVLIVFKFQSRMEEGAGVRKEGRCTLPPLQVVNSKQ